MPVANFDIEHLLTNAVLRVLNKDSSPIRRHENSSNPGQLVKFQPNRPNYTGREQFPSTSNNVKKHDVHLQMRVIAEHVVHKLERRFEERLEREVARNSQRAERRIEQMREEYNAARREMGQKMEKLRSQIEADFREKMRQREQQLAISYAEKESALEIERKLVQNRASELWMNKEQFDNLKEQFRLKMEKDLEALRLEREKIELMPCRCGKIRDFKFIGREETAFNEDQEITAQEKLWRFELDLRQREEELRRSEESRRFDAENFERERDTWRAQRERERLENEEETSRREERWRKRLEEAARENEEIARDKYKMITKIQDLESELEKVNRQLKSTQKALLGEDRERRKRGRIQRFQRPSSPSSTSLSDDELNLAQIKTRIHAIDKMTREMDQLIDNLDIRNEDMDLEVSERRFIREEPKISILPQERNFEQIRSSIKREPENQRDEQQKLPEMSPKISSTQDERTEETREETKQESALDAYLAMIKQSNERRKREIVVEEKEPEQDKEAVRLDKDDAQNDDYSW